MGFTVESMTAARPPYSLSFRHLKDINQFNLIGYRKRNIVVLMLATLDF